MGGQPKNVIFLSADAFGVLPPLAKLTKTDDILNTRNTWSNPADYDAQAKKLAQMFAENFKQYADEATPEILAAGPSAY